MCIPDFILAADCDRDKLDLFVRVLMSQLEVDHSDGSGLSGSVPRNGGHGELLALGLVGSAVVGLERHTLDNDTKAFIFCCAWLSGRRRILHLQNSYR